MKYCAKCGKMHADDTVEVCKGCGHVFSDFFQNDYQRARRSQTRKTVTIIVIIIAVIAVVVGGFYARKQMRINNVIRELSSTSYEYFDDHHYYALDKYTYEIKSFSFDSNGVLTYSYYYSNIDSGDEYIRDYTIEFEGDRVYLVCGLENKKYEIQYDENGYIKSLYDTELKELYQ